MHERRRPPDDCSDPRVFLYGLLMLMSVMWNAQGSPAPLEVIDLTRVFDNSTSRKADQTSFELRVNGSRREGNWLQLERYESGTHVGTHLDAPRHLHRNGWTVDRIPTDRLLGPAAVVDSERTLTVRELLRWEKTTGENLTGTIVLVRSGRRPPQSVTPSRNVTGTRRMNETETTRTLRNETSGTVRNETSRSMRNETTRTVRNGTYGNETAGRGYPSGTARPDRNETLTDVPSISEEAARFLVYNRSINGLGIETLSLDMDESKNAATLRIVTENNAYVLQNLANVDKLPQYGATLYVMPMKIAHAGAAPARIFATFPKVVFSKVEAAGEGTLREIIIFSKY